MLEVRPPNTAAIRLDQKLGFSEIGVRRNYSPQTTGCARTRCCWR